MSGEFTAKVTVKGIGLDVTCTETKFTIAK
jgi:hypothetical protein